MTGTDPAFVLSASKRHASALGFTPDGATLITGGMEGVLKAWDVGTWEGTAAIDGHKKSVNHVSFAPDKARYVSSGTDQRVVIRDLKSHDALVTLDKYDGAWFAPKAPHIVLSKARSPRLYVYDEQADDVVAAFDSGLKVVGWPTFMKNGEMVVTGYGDAASLRQLPTGEETASLGGHATSVIGAAGLPDGKRLATTDYAGRLRIWDVVKRAVTAEWDTGMKGYAFVAAAPKGNRVASTADKAIALWSLQGELLGRAPVALKGLYNLAFDATGEWLVNAAADGKVRVWRVKDLVKAGA